MNEQTVFIHETSASLSDTAVGAVSQKWQSKPIEVQKCRVEWAAKKAVPDGCRYQIISESQFPPDFDNYDWDYSNYDGIGQSNPFTQSWDEYVTQSLSL